MQRADDPLVPLGHLTERARPQQHFCRALGAARLDSRVESHAGQQPRELSQGVVGGRLPVRWRLLGEETSPLAAGLFRGQRRFVGQAYHQAGKHFRQQPVAALSGWSFWPAGAGGPVADGWAARSVPAAFRAVATGGKPGIDECVQVEPGRVGVQAAPVCDLRRGQRLVRVPEQFEYASPAAAERSAGVGGEKLTGIHGPTLRLISTFQPGTFAPDPGPH
jgi:hypothetical protein